jgi:FKBP-type peptidyl-prolyl cis-trans isomerase
MTIGFLALAGWGCGPPQVAPVLPPGVELPPPKPTEAEAAKALGEYGLKAAAQEGNSAKANMPVIVAEPTKVGDTRTTTSGLKYSTIKEGTGPQAKPGMLATVHYTGTFEDGQKFDSSRDKGQPLTFQLGAKQVIAGWDEGVAGMKVGERRKLTVPYELGYGVRGDPPVIPGRATLLFDVELLDVK